jgi:hypothetical protein
MKYPILLNGANSTNDGVSSVVTATQSSETMEGTYPVFRDDNSTELRMTFPNNSLPNERSDEWDFICQTALTAQFQDHFGSIQFSIQ